MEEQKLSGETRLKPYKKDHDYSYSFGVFPTLELLEYFPRSVLRIILSSNGKENEGVEKLCVKSATYGIDSIVDDKTLIRISPKENCYAIGVFNKYTMTLNTDFNHVVLVNPSDMGNLGTIIRTLVAFGIYDLAIITPSVDIFDPKVIRASMGAIFKIRFRFFQSFEHYLKIVPNHKLYPFMLDGSSCLETVVTQYTKLYRSSPYSLIFGNESKGLDSEYSFIGNPVKISHLNTVDSLNLSVAVAIGVQRFTLKNFEE